MDLFGSHDTHSPALIGVRILATKGVPPNVHDDVKPLVEQVAAPRIVTPVSSPQQFEPPRIRLRRPSASRRPEGPAHLQAQPHPRPNVGATRGIDIVHIDRQREHGEHADEDEHEENEHLSPLVGALGCHGVTGSMRKRAVDAMFPLPGSHGKNTGICAETVTQIQTSSLLLAGGQ